MNSPVALISTAVDSCVPTKLSLDALGLSCSRVLAHAWLPSSGVTGADKKNSAQLLCAPSILLIKASPTAIASPAAICTPPPRYFSHT